MAKKKSAIVLGESCSVVDRTPCDYKVAIGLAAQTARKYGLASAPQLQTIQNRGTVSKAEAGRVLRTWARQLTASAQVPADQKTWAAVVLDRL